MPLKMFQKDFWIYWDLHPGTVWLNGWIIKLLLTKTSSKGIKNTTNCNCLACSQKKKKRQSLREAQWVVKGKILHKSLILNNQYKNAYMLVWNSYGLRIRNARSFYTESCNRIINEQNNKIPGTNISRIHKTMCLPSPKKEVLNKSLFPKLRTW